MDLPPSPSDPSRPTYLSAKNLPETMQPREKLKKFSAARLTDEELIAVILGSGAPGNNVVDLAKALLIKLEINHVSLADAQYEDFLRLSREHDKQLAGFGEVKCVQLAAAMELARRVNCQIQKERPADYANNPDCVYQILFPLLRELQQEKFWVLALDVKNGLIGQPLEVSVGTIDQAMVHPREVFKLPIRFAAKNLILAHNHPTGDPTPSRQDLDLTRRMIECGELLGIPILDHIVIGSHRGRDDREAYVSLRRDFPRIFKRKD